MAAVAAQYRDRVTFLGIPGLGQMGEMRTFVADTGTGAFTHVVDDDGSRWQRFGVVAQPAFAFVGRDGTSRTFAGSMSEDELRHSVDELLAR